MNHILRAARLTLMGSPQQGRVAPTSRRAEALARSCISSPLAVPLAGSEYEVVPGLVVRRPFFRITSPIVVRMLTSNSLQIGSRPYLLILYVIGDATWCYCDTGSRSSPAAAMSWSGEGAWSRAKEIASG